MTTADRDLPAFKSLLASVKPLAEPSEYAARIDASWLQGRTTFGGLSTALVYQAMQGEVAAERRLRTLSVSFVGPAPAGEHRITTRLLREGGSVTHMQGELLCDGAVAASVLAAFGKARQTSVRVDGPPRPQQPAPEALQPLPFIEGVTPEFTRHFDMRFSYGEPPFSRAPSADFGMWLRFREAQAIGLAELIALGDVPPMPGLNMIKAPGIGSSLSWYLEFPADLPEVASEDFLYYDYRCQAAGDGYFNNAATLWAADGRPLMFARQIATVFER